MERSPLFAEGGQTAWEARGRMLPRFFTVS